MSNQKNPIFGTGFFARLFGGEAVQRDKTRLEAFINALPGAYCGWSDDNTVAYNRDVCRLLNLTDIAVIEDISDALSLEDAARLEEKFAALQKHGDMFSLETESAAGDKIFRIRGTRGESPDRTLTVCLLWFDDITGQKNHAQTLEKETERAQAEQSRLQGALNKLPFPVWMRDTDGQILWCNESYADVLETTPATVIAEQKNLPFKFTSLSDKKVRTADKIKPEELAQKAVESSGRERRQAHLIVDGERRLMTVTESYLPSLAGTVGLCLDITAVEEVETKLRRYKMANKELLEQLGTAIGIFDASRNLEFYNAAFAQLWGLEEKYLDSRPRLGEFMEKLRETRRLPEQADFREFKSSWLDMFTSLLEPHEDMLYLPDGSALRMLVIPHPMGGLMMTFENVTSRLELESSYNTLIAVQKETLDNLAEGVVVFGGDGRVKLWNPSFAGQWGLNPEDLDNEPHVSQLAAKMKKNFVEEDWVENKQKIVAQSLDRKSKEGRFVLEDGRVVHYSTMPLPDGGVLVTHVDVTDTTMVEAALREKNAALEAAEQLKTDFLANVSYQLRTPLNAIMGFTEILDNEYFGSLNERQKDYTTNMKFAGERLLHLIDDILDLSTLEAGYMDLDYETVDIGDILESIHDLTMDWARKEGITLALDYKKSIGTMAADERRLKQVLINLVRNAIAHTPENGKIAIQAEKEEGEVLLTVSDTGPGIPEGDQKRIFEPFERLSGSQAYDTQDRGAGLGLSLVKNIVEIHGGEIDVESRVDEGATFTIRLPVGQVKAESGDQKKSA